MIELKPCPFCGNADITGATHKPVGSAEFYEVICVECGAEIEYRIYIGDEKEENDEQKE